MNKLVTLAASELKELRAASQKSVLVSTLADKKNPKKVLDFVKVTLQAGKDRPKAKYDESFYCALPLSKFDGVSPKKFGKYCASNSDDILLLFGNDFAKRKKEKESILKKIDSGKLSKKKSKKLLKALPEAYEYDYFQLWFLVESKKGHSVQILVTGNVNYDTYEEEAEDGSVEVFRRRYLNAKEVYHEGNAINIRKVNDVKDLRKISDSIIAKFR